MDASKKHYFLYDELAAIVGTKFVTDEGFALWSVSHDSSPFPGKASGIIVLPGTVEEVSEVLKLANITKTPVIPRGGGASLFGFPTGVPGRNILIQLTRLNKLVEINKENMTVTAQAGITTGELSTKVWEEGFHIHTVHTPLYTDTIGGLLTGAGGGGFPMEAASAGCIWPYVLGFEVVLPDGSIIKTGAGSGTNTFREKTFDRVFSAPDITGMFIGDGGIFGIKTEVTMQILPRPDVIETGGFIFKKMEDLWASMSSLMNIEPLPYSRIYGIGPEGFNARTGKTGNDWGLLYGVLGYSQEEVGLKIEAIERICRKLGGRGLPDGYEEILTDLDQIDPKSYREMGKRSSMGMWAFMEEFASKEGFLEYYKTTRDYTDNVFKKERLEEYGCKRFDLIIPFGHTSVYLGNNIFYDQGSPELREKLLEIVKEHTIFVTKLGASMDVHQGFAAEVMASYWSPTFYNFMHVLKRAIDPNNILCPGLWKL